MFLHVAVALCLVSAPGQAPPKAKSASKSRGAPSKVRDADLDVSVDDAPSPGNAPRLSAPTGAPAVQPSAPSGTTGTSGTPASPAPTATAAPAPARPASVDQPAKSPLSGVPTVELVARAKQLYGDLEFGKVIPVTEELLTRKDLTSDQLLDTYSLKGSSLAIVGDPVEAEKPFRFLLRGRPDYEMPTDTSPKIMAVFRKVQVEERAIVAEMRKVERENMIKELALTGNHPEAAVGGQPIVFEYKLRDPRTAVADVSVQFRRQGERAYSSLALKPDPESGAWRGEIPGEWTASPDGFWADYFVSTVSANGEELLKVWDATSPKVIKVEPGALSDGAPFYETTWFWVVATGVVVASGAAGYLIYRQASALPDSDLGEFPIR